MARRNDYLGRVENWPEGDRRRWDDVWSVADASDLDRTGPDWRPAMILAVVQNYGCWLTWLRDRSMLDLSQMPEDRVTRERVRHYLGDLGLRLSPQTVRHRLTHLERALFVLAPSFDRRWLRIIINRLSNTIDHTTKRARLQEPGIIVELGQSLMDDGELGLRDCPRRNAVLFRDGLLIALLAMRPLRVRSLLSMQIGTHLLKSSAGWMIEIPGEDTKNKRSLSYPFPLDLVPALERYLDHHRPLLAGAWYRGDRLWLSFHYRPLGHRGLHTQICGSTRRIFGNATRTCSTTARRPRWQFTTLPASESSPRSSARTPMRLPSGTTICRARSMRAAHTSRLSMR